MDIETILRDFQNKTIELKTKLKTKFNKNVIFSRNDHFLLDLIDVSQSQINLASNKIIEEFEEKNNESVASELLHVSIFHLCMNLVSNF